MSTDLRYVLAADPPPEDGRQAAAVKLSRREARREQIDRLVERRRGVRLRLAKRFV